jgi:hypothetical protein
MTNFISNEIRDYANKVVESFVRVGLIENRRSYNEFSFSDWYKSKNLDSYGFSYSCGVSKVCLFHPQLENFVIKFGFSDITSQTDYCVIEYENYLRAKENGFEEYFPYTDFLCEYEEVSFFIQEKAVCSEDDITSGWYHSMREVMEADCDEDDDDFNSRIWDAVYDMDDIQRADFTFCDEAFTDFLIKYGIGDLHEGNFGYIGNRTVIIDFSGWRG